MAGLPDYDSPPLVEVAVGLSFDRLPGFRIQHVGMLCERFAPLYPTLREQPPLPMVLEAVGRPTSIELTALEGPPLPRIWLIDEGEECLLQFQPDRFLRNWRRTSGAGVYPRYPRVIKSFWEDFDRFLKYLEDMSLQRPHPIQCELTYVNQIESTEAWPGVHDMKSLLPDFHWTPRRRGFLPTVDSCEWNTSFAIPNDAGRLHATVRASSTIANGRPGARIDLTARGIGNDTTRAGLVSWFDVAHEWIVRGFADITSMTAQQNMWGLRT